MSALQHKLMTIAEFEQLPSPEDGSQLELVRGEVVVMPSPQGPHGICCANVTFLLQAHVKPQKLGWVAGNDTGVILERNPDTVRGPDVAFWSITRQPSVPDGWFEIPPDLAVEVLSPSDRPKAVRDKIKDYVHNGVRLVWLVDPDTRTVTVYRGTMRGSKRRINDTLDGGDVLPGFSCKVAELFE